jgi:hypothetical protein
MDMKGYAPQPIRAYALSTQSVIRTIRMDTMTALPQVMKFGCRAASAATLFAATAIAAQAQNSIPVFPTSVTVRLSTSGTSNSSPSIFGTSTQNVSCPESGIVAKVSSTADGTGKVLVDNYLNLTLAQGGSITGPTNICRGGVSAYGYNHCFTTGYQSPAGAGELTGDDPNGVITAAGGVGPIDISALLLPGANTLKFDEVDTGGYLAASSVYLNTNCTAEGAGGTGTVTGTPISSTDPTPAELTQSFTFSGTTGKFVGLVLDLSNANTAGTLSVTNQATPTAVDTAFNPAAWPSFAAGTSFATSQCLIHLGEIFDGSPACKLYTLTCQIGQGTDASGANCPTSSERNIVIQDVFDFPTLSLPDIKFHTESGGVETYKQGFGLLEVSEGWTGGPCAFTDGVGGIFSCPQNLLTDFEGPGVGKGSGTPQPVIHSSFISVGPVPEIYTSEHIETYGTDNWINSRKVNVLFSAHPPRVPPPNNGFVASPVYSITYGVSLLDALPPTEFPVPGDTTLLNPEGCPGSLPAKVFTPGPAPVSVPADGNYFIHYFGTDCAGTEELHYWEDSNKSWHAEFLTIALNVDTVPPKIAAGPTLSPAPTSIDGTVGYCKNQSVKATFTCTDDRSGVKWCGGKIYSDPILTPPPHSEAMDTSTVGPHTFTAHTEDVAQNQGTPVSVNYNVVECSGP